MPGDVRDAYVAGRGSMMATMFGAYSMVDQSETPQLASGALQRYLGEGGVVSHGTAAAPPKSRLHNLP